MAITPDFSSLKARVHVNRKPLKEYSDDPDSETNPRTVTKYIEAVSDANFEIRYSISKDFPKCEGVLVSAYVDGIAVSSYVFESHALSGSRLRSKVDVAVSIDGDTKRLQKFRFSKVVISDDVQPSSLTQARSLEELGQICLKFNLISSIKYQKPIGKVGPVFGPNQPFQEKFLKGRGDTLSHQTSFDTAEICCLTEQRAIFDYVGGRENILAQFTFKYRSKAALKALHILPRTPSPAPPQDSELDNLSREELLSRLKDYQKRDRASSQATNEAVVKREQSDRNEAQGRVKREIVGDDKLAVVSERQVKRPRPSIEREVIELE